MPAKMTRITSWILTILFVLATCSTLTGLASGEDTIPIAEVKHDGPVSFEKEILPIFRRNCLACHNKTDAESDLVLAPE